MDAEPAARQRLEAGEAARPHYDAAKGLISFRSPVAQAILGVRVGDVIEAGEPLGEMEVIGID